jgi:hypothetical protein
MPEMVWYRTKLAQSDIVLVRYRTEMMDFRNADAEGSFSMPMPWYISITK